MTDHELEQRIRTAVEHAAPDRLDKILSSCDQQNTVACTPVYREGAGGKTEGAVIDMSKQKNKNSKHRRAKKSLAAIAAAAAGFVLCFGGYNLFQRNMAPIVDSVVMLDVNPSLSLSVDAEEKVLSVEALNDDAKEVLGSMELKNTSLEVAVNAIIGSMLQKGYLGDLQNAILVSVENEDTVQGEALQQKVTEAIVNAARNGSLDAAVLSQLISTEDADLAELAKQYRISLGKTALIQEVISQVPTLTFEDLAPMTINEIALIAASKNVTSTSVTQSGAASDKAYIAQEKALDVVYSHAGVNVEDVLKEEVEFDSKNGTMIYEVEFETSTKEGEYEVDASTGEIIKAELKDRDGSGENSGYIGAAAAKESALAHAGIGAEDVLEIEIELDSDDHAMIYKVEFKTDTRKYEYEIDAITGTVLTYDAKEQKNTTGGNTVSGISADNKNYIGESAAKEAALSHANVTESDTAYVKCYLEYEGGRPACYCVEFKVNKTEYEYEIDLYSGAVLDYDTENHDNYGSSGNNSSDSPADTSYIGESAALAAALNHAGVKESALKEKHVEFDRDGNTMIYKIEFETSSEEYEYKIDVVIGEILKNEKHTS